MKQRYFHIRNVELHPTHNEILPHGGVTISVTPAQRGFVTVRFSECSLKDNFCRRTGRSFADKRAGAGIPVESLPDVMATIVMTSKRVQSPSITDFDFATKYFKE